MRSDHLAKHVKTHANVSRKNKKSKEDDKEEASDASNEKSERPVESQVTSPSAPVIGSTNYGTVPTVPATNASKQMSLNYAAVAPTMVSSSSNYNSAPVFGSGMMSGWYPEMRQDAFYPRPPVRDHRMYQQYTTPITTYQCAGKDNYTMFQGHYNLQPSVALGQ